MIKSSSINSFSLLYLRAHGELLKALKGEEHNFEHFDLATIYPATADFFDEIRSSLNSSTTLPETDIIDVYYEAICFNLLIFKQLHQDYRLTHWSTDLFTKVSRCFEQLKELAENTRERAARVGIKLRRFNELDLLTDYALGGSYIGNNDKAVETPIAVDSPVLEPEAQDKMSISEIALKYVYEGVQITRGNSNDIAREYGHTSGEKLFQRYTFFLSTANRKARPHPCTEKKLKNKIELIEKVIDKLPEENRGKALDEVNILKSIFNSEYQ